MNESPFQHRPRFPARRQAALYGSALFCAVGLCVAAFGASSSSSSSFPASLPAATAQALDAARPIASRASVFLEDLTWMEVRDAIASGKTTILVPTGGIEQSGPYLPVGKHNFILNRTMELVARGLGDTLVAPIVKYVPEGDIAPATGHMMFPGTISLREDLFILTLKEIAKSLRRGGFQTIVLLGDSGDNQHGMEKAAQELTLEWQGDRAQILFVPEYYDYRDTEKWLTSKGYVQHAEGIHDDLAFTSQLAAIDENLVRYNERAGSGRLSINGISIGDKGKLQSLGREILEMRARKTEGVIRDRRRPKLEP